MMTNTNTATPEVSIRWTRVELLADAWAWHAWLCAQDALEAESTPVTQASVREHAKRGGFPANRVSAVRRLIDPVNYQ